MTASSGKKALQLDDCWNRIGIWATDGASCPELGQVTHCRNCAVYSAAGRRILDRRAPEGYREEWTRIYAGDKNVASQHRNSVLVFRIGDDWLALRSRLVQEITEVRTIHSLPHRRGSVVRGLVNIRGELRICISLGNLLGLHQGEVTSQDLGYDVFARMVVIARDDDQYVFPVTEVHGVHRFDDNQLHGVPATIGKAKATYTRNIMEWKEQHVACLDDELLLYALGKGLT